MNILIIGGGVAAYEAAVAAAAQGIHKVTLCSKEAVPPYRRPALSRMVAEEVADNAFYFKPASFYEEHGIELLLEKEAVSLDRSEKKVTFSDGSILPYDRLILATGGNAFVPPVEGAGFAHVLRDYKDLQFFRQAIASGVRTATVIGGGVLGLELADSLLARGCAVTIVENNPSVLGRNLDDEGARRVMAHLNTIPKLSVKVSSKVVKITPDTVQLEQESFSSDLTVFSAGVRCSVRLAEEAGLEIGRGIAVDLKMRSSDPDIFSCGDAAEPPGGCSGLLTAAKAMGRIAGINAAGGDESYTPEAAPVRLMALGIKLFSAGKINDAVSESSCDGENYQRLTRNGKGDLTGVILLGDLKAAVKLQKELVL